MFSVVSGQIRKNVLYEVGGDQSVTYAGIIYNTGERFRGDEANDFVYSGTGTQSVYEVFELQGCSIEFLQTVEDIQFAAETTKIKGFTIEFELNEAEKLVRETTEIKGFAIELVDFPIFAFTILERRF